MARKTHEFLMAHVINLKINFFRRKPKFNFIANTGLYLLRKDIIKLIDMEKDRNDRIDYKCLKKKIKIGIYETMLMSGQILGSYLTLEKL